MHSSRAQRPSQNLPESSCPALPVCLVPPRAPFTDFFFHRLNELSSFSFSFGCAEAAAAAAADAAAEEVTVVPDPTPAPAEGEAAAEAGFEAGEDMARATPSPTEVGRAEDTVRPIRSRGKSSRCGRWSGRGGVGKRELLG